MGVCRRKIDPTDPGHLLGRYAVFGWKRGGMGVILQGWDPELKRKVAIKLWIDEEANAKIIKEAETLARFTEHRNIVTVFDVGTWKRRHYFVMEWIDGCDVREWLGTPRTWREIRDLFVEAGRGLAAAHAAKTEHRDFKPSNILVSADGDRVCVCDFGLADTISSPDATIQTFAGTVSYMSPERMRCEKGDGRSDQFSFCVSLWEALHRRMPYWGKTLPALLAAIENHDIQPGSPRADVPHWLSRVVRKGLHPDPDLRYPDMDALLEALTSDPPAGDATEGGIDSESDLFETSGYMHAPANSDTVVLGASNVGNEPVDVALGSATVERARLVHMGAASLGGALAGTVIALWVYFSLQVPVLAPRPQLEIAALEVVAVKIDKLQLGIQKLDEANRILDAQVVTAADTQRAYELWLESQPSLMSAMPRYFGVKSLALAKRIDALDHGRRFTAWVAADAASAFRDVQEWKRASAAACEAAKLASASGNQVMAAELKNSAAKYDPEGRCEVPQPD